MTQKLLDGFLKYRADDSVWGDEGLMTRLMRDGQKPEFMIISCVDSRTNPGTIFNALPGACFVFRAPGAIIRPYKTGTALAATLQIAIDAGVSNIVVLGHTGCAAMQHLIEHAQDPEIEGFLKVAESAREHARTLVDTDDKESFQNETGRQAAILSGENLKTYPAVANAIQAGKLQLDVWMFDMHDGNILTYDPDQKTFNPLTFFKAGKTDQTPNKAARTGG